MKNHFNSKMNENDLNESLVSSEDDTSSNIRSNHLVNDQHSISLRKSTSSSAVSLSSTMSPKPPSRRYLTFEEWNLILIQTYFNVLILSYG